MTIEELAHRQGEWLSGRGPQADIVVSTRIRLARNLAGYPFLTKCSETQRREIHRRLSETILQIRGSNGLGYFDIEQVDDLDRQVLVERQLISRQHAGGRGSRGVVISETETLSVMINEEDHLRTQVLRSGLLLDEAWEEINALDDALDERIDFAFHPKYGYLTACPTNVGTGIRVSVMVHLPALKLAGQLERVIRATRDMRIAVRGLFGEGTQAIGDLYQISNQTTLGRSETEIIAEFRDDILPAIVNYEQRARSALLKEKSALLDDRICRALGVLRYARSLSSEETLNLLSHVRLGISLGRIDEVDLRTVNELFLKTQPAHLQRLLGRPMNREERDVARAEMVRQRFEQR